MSFLFLIPISEKVFALSFGDDAGTLRNCSALHLDPLAPVPKALPRQLRLGLACRHQSLPHTCVGGWVGGGVRARAYIHK